MTDDALLTLMPKIESRARRLAATREEADDMAQETALRLLQVLQGDTEIAAPEHYAMTLLHNLARQSWRGRRPMEELTEDMMQANPEAPARLACAELQKALSALPAPQAQLIRLVMGGETSPQALAELLGLPKGTVMSRLGRARAQLRAALGVKRSVVELL